jgi:DNA-binding ferritin-like protein (Dps family)
MKEIDIYNYYFGFNYHIWKSGFSGRTNASAKGALEEYLEYISELELQVTAQITEDLAEIANSLTEDNKTIDDKIAKKLRIL